MAGTVFGRLAGNHAAAYTSKNEAQATGSEPTRRAS